MQIIETPITDCYELRPCVLGDSRGSFVKIYQKSLFSKYNLNNNFCEEYYSTSSKNVLRGFHFQLPPHDHAKMVFCMSGEVFDVVIDLRKGSPTYRMHHVFSLSGSIGNGLYVDRGFAHAFLALTDGSTLLYNVTSEYSPANDTGIKWNSAGVKWPGDNFIISARDNTFPTLDKWDSPFVWRG